MKISAKIIFLLLFISPVLNKSFSQSIAIGEWRDHLPYNNCISICEGNGVIYCATKYGVFSYDINDNSIQRMTKVNYLSDIGVSRIAYDKALKILIVAYSDGNIDLIENNSTTNISDIKNDPVPGLKTINNIMIVGNYAYLSCGFGIVVLDLVKQEIQDTYYIGSNGSHIQIFDMTFDGTNLYAATISGIYKANINDPDLDDYQSWSKDTVIPHPNATYNYMVYFNNSLFVNLAGGGDNNDTLFKYKSGVWSHFDSSNFYTRYGLHVNNNQLVVVEIYDVKMFDTNDFAFSTIWTYNPAIPAPRDAIIDQDNNNIVWVADNVLGIVKDVNTYNCNFYQPNGPYSTSVCNMSVEGSNLWVASGGLTSAWGNTYNRDGLFSFINGTWTTYNSASISALDTIYDMICTCVNPANPSNVFAGTWSRGLLQFDNQQLTKIYGESNSTLLGNGLPLNNSMYRLKIGGICFDTLGNMWVANSGVNSLINVRKANGQWKAFNLSGVLPDNEAGQIVIDRFNQKWVIIPRDNGLLVFNDNNTIDDVSDDHAIVLTNATGHGALPSNNLFCLAVDRDGEIWVGTDQGVGVFYNPENVFSGNNFDAQQILVNEGGYIQPLLASEIVTAIAVDGANRKWIGTQGAGVFLMSADGTQQIENFTAENSPLFSNVIMSIAIDQKTGEVYFGTDKGIVSYKGNSTEGGDDFSDVLVYPNPVRHGYNGDIAIKGLAANADVRITDITGTAIYQTIAEGGQAIWNGNNYSGKRAQTGVYLVFCASPDGSKRLVTKILLIN